jgi:hypothetical protein
MGALAGSAVWRTSNGSTTCRGSLAGSRSRCSPSCSRPRTRRRRGRAGDWRPVREHGRARVPRRRTRSCSMCATSSRGSADEGGAGGIGGSHRQDGSRADFEASFRSFHDTVPVIHQMTSKDLSAGELGVIGSASCTSTAATSTKPRPRTSGSHPRSRPRAAWSRSTTSRTWAIPASPLRSGPRSWNATWSRTPGRRRSSTQPEKTIWLTGTARAFEEVAAASGYHSRLTVSRELHPEHLAVASAASLRVRVAGRLRRMARRPLGTSPAPFVSERVFGS